MSGFYSALVNEVRRLYELVVLSILHKRINDYHQHSDYVASPHAGEIKSALLSYIDNVPVIDSPSKKTIFNAASIIPAHPEPDKYLKEAYPTDTHRVNNYKHVGDLSKYFKSRRKAYELMPGIKDKLKLSVWEHINASIRCAHKGDKRNAKMHIDIANSAFKEVSHYLPEQQYAEFSEKVNQHLNALKSA